MLLSEEQFRSWTVQILILLPLLLTIFYRFSAADQTASVCPPSISKEVCQNETRLRLQIQYSLNLRGVCIRHLKTHILKDIECPAPRIVKSSSCKAGQLTEWYESFKYKNCNCEKIIHRQEKPCPCKPCETVRSPCNQETKSSVVLTRCYHHTDKGSCQPSLKTTYAECGECKSGMSKRIAPCNFCKGHRNVEILTTFREEDGQRRCLVARRLVHEPCSCKQGVWSKKVCLNKDTMVRKIIHRSQISCSVCQLKKFQIADRRIKCRGRVIAKRPCKLDPTTGYSHQIVQVIHEFAEGCECKRLVHSVKQVCACPSEVSRESSCYTQTNTLFIKLSGYKLIRHDDGRSQCRLRVRIQRVPPPQCPPLVNHNVTLAHGQSEFECDRRTCERLILSTDWQLEGCRCKKITQRRPAGLCCCPKRQSIVSDCINNIRTVRNVYFELFNGQCQRHVTVGVEPCGDISPSESFNCDTETGIKVYKTVEIQRMGSGASVETIQIRRIPTLCKGVEVVSVSSCEEKEPGSKLYFRNVLLISRRRMGCECAAPESRVVTEACKCVDSDTGHLVQSGEEIKIETGCRPDCFPGSDACGTSQCKNVQQWVKMEYISDDTGESSMVINGTQVKRCKRTLIRRDVSDCCCPKDPQVERECDMSGKDFLFKQTKFSFKHGLCVQSVVQWKERVNCTNGFIGREFGEKQEDGTQEVRMLFEATEGCRCERYLQRMDCHWRCPKPEQRTYCDTLFKETIQETIKYVLIGCKCQRQVQRVRSKAACPKYAVVLSRQCSPATGLEKVITKTIIQDGCACKVVLHTKFSKCVCPPEERSAPRCNEITNQIEQRVKRWLLIGGKCQSIAEVSSRPIVCSDEVKVENLTALTKLTCDEKTGWGQLAKTKWTVERCQCLQKKHIIHEGPCRCPSPKTVTQCDMKRGLLVYKTAMFELNRATLRCVAHVETKEEKLECPKPEQVIGECNVTTGQQPLFHITYKLEECGCKRFEAQTATACVCPQTQAATISPPKCDPERREHVIEKHKRVWQNEQRKCVDVLEIIRVPAVCKPHVQYVLGKCENGVQQIRLIVRTLDSNSCQCVVKFSVKKIDCRCPPKRLLIGKCSEGEDSRISMVIEKTWNREKNRCVIVTRRRQRLLCKCAVDREESTCKDGVIQFKREKSELYAGGYACKRLIEIRPFLPDCLQNGKHLAREQASQCDKGTCKREVELYLRSYDAKTCQCIWRLQSKRQCSCCGCPKRSIQLKCLNDTSIIAVASYFVPIVSGCGHTCKRMTKIFRKQAQCKQLPAFEKPKWSECDRSTCIQKLTGMVFVVVKCHCKLTHKVFASRKCCCPSGKTETEKCHEGKLLTVVKSFELRDFQCRDKVDYELKSQVCETTPERKRGACDPGTCKRNIYEVVSMRDKQSCECRSAQRLVRREDCCCPPTPKPKALCVGSCNVEIRVQSQFDTDQSRCIQIQQVYKKCPSCSQSYEEQGQCDRKDTCLQTVRSISYTVENCECKQQVSFKTRPCCCKSPPQEPPKCIEDEHVLMYKRVKYSLIGGECVARTYEMSVPIVCPPKDSLQPFLPTIERGPCDTNTCHRTVFETTWSLSGCACTRTRQERLEPCCCTQNPRRVKSLCQNDGRLIKEIRNWKLLDGKCVPEIIKEQIPKLDCPSIRRQPTGPCNTRTGRQPIEINKYELDHCQCRLIWSGRKDRLCSCPEDETVSLRCDPSTCQQEVVETRYLAKNGTCHRLPSTRSVVPCCCRSDEVKRVTKRVCDSAMGRMWEIRSFNKFDRELKKCVPTSVQRRIEFKSCDTRAQIRHGICNSITGYATDVVTVGAISRRTCLCQTREISVQRACGCAHLSVPDEQVKCDELTNTIETFAVVYKLQNGACVKTDNISRRKVVCPQPEVNKHKCDPKSCLSIIETINYDHKQCQCVKKVSKSQEKCCCPSDQSSNHCLENGTLSLRRYEQFRFNADTNKCEKSFYFEKREIACNTKDPVTLKQTCDRDTCHPVSEIARFKLQNCKCVPEKVLIVHKEKDCCCPPPRMALNCFKQTNMLQSIKYEYELLKGSCVTRKSVTQEKVFCPEEKIDVGACDPVTKRRPTTRIFYSIDDCKCIRKTERSLQTCGCPNTVIIKELCRPQMKMRNVTRISFRKLHPADEKKPVVCAKKIQFLRAELCSCPETKIEKKCVDGKFQLHTTVHRLIERNGKFSCARDVKVTTEAATCPADMETRTVNGECINFRRKVITFRQELEPSLCSCQVKRDVRVEVCDCEKKNFLNKECKNDVMIISRGHFASSTGDRHCNIKASQTMQPIICPRNEQVVNPGAGCTVIRGGGIYRPEVMRWQEINNCNCVNREKTEYKLCSCAKPQEARRCEDDSKLVVESINYLQVNGMCLPNRQVANTEIHCDEVTRVVGVSGCLKAKSSANSSEECMETITIDERVVKACKCIQRIRKFRRLCCVPPSLVERKCDKASGRWLTTTTRYKLNEGKVLFASTNFEVRSREQDTITDEKSEQIICAEKEISEQCDQVTGLWTKTTVSYLRKGCSCRAIKEVKVGKCSCQKQKAWASQCIQDFRAVRIVFFRLIDQKCVRFTKVARQRCACPKPFRRVYCDGAGRWVKCLTEFIFNKEAHNCRVSKQCVRWSPTCPPVKNEVVTVCSDANRHRQTLNAIEYTLDLSTCLCRGRVTKSWKEYCRCDHLNNKTSSCSGEVRVTKVTTHNLLEGRCIAKEMTEVEKIACPETRVERGNCELSRQSKNRGTLLRRVHSHAIIGCTCIPRTENFTEICDCNLRHGVSRIAKCVGDDEMELSITSWTSKNGNCESSVSVNRKRIDCSKRSTMASLYKTIKKSCLIGKDGYGHRTVTTFAARAKGCKCVSVPVATETEICGCPHTRTQEGCAKDGQLILRRSLSFELSEKNGKPVCLQKLNELLVEPCSEIKEKSWETPGKCDQKTCKRSIDVFKRVAKNCTCVLKKFSRLETCCCPPETKAETKCLPREHRLLETFKTYQLISTLQIGTRVRNVEPFCDSQVHSRSSIVSCVDLKPRILMSKCINTFRAVRVIVKRPIDCKCADHILHTARIRCGCPKTVKMIRGQCKGAWAEDKWVGLQGIAYAQTIKKGTKLRSVHCRPLLLRQRKRRCACPDPQVLRHCMSGNQLRIIHTSFKLNATTNECERHVLQKTHPTICPKAHYLSSACGGVETEFTATRTTTNWTAVDCVCVPQTFQKRFVCNCPAKYPMQQNESCKQGRIKEVTITTSVLSDLKCIPSLNKTAMRVTCVGKPRSVKGVCDKRTHRKPIQWLRHVPINCTCQWQPMLPVEAKSLGLKVTEACACSKSDIQRKCMAGSFSNGPSSRMMHEVLEMTRTRFSLVDGECVPLLQTVRRNITCLVGTYTSRTVCDPVTRENVETRVTRSLHNCECKEVSASRKCQCICPPPRIRAVCNQRAGILRIVKEAHQLDASNCTCIVSVKSTDKKIDCAEGIPFDRVMGPCQPAPANISQIAGDTFRLITWKSVSREDCKCIKRSHKMFEPCSCAKKAEITSRCINREVREIIASERVLTSDHKCIFKVVSRKLQQINCPEAKTTSKCDNRTGIAEITRLQPFLEDCICKNKVQTYKIRCKCDSQLKLVKKTVCSQDCKVTIIHRRDTLSSEGSCKPEFIATVKQCCCPKPRIIREHCDTANGMSSIHHRKFVLVQGDCLHEDRIITQPTVCPTNETTRVLKEASGWLRFERSISIRIGCHCHTKTQISRKRWKCPKSSKKRTCVEMPNYAQAWKTILVMWKSAKTQPICSRREVFTSLAPVICSIPPQRVSACIYDATRHAFIRRVTISKSRVEGCRCIEETPTVVYEVCRCAPPIKRMQCSKTDGMIFLTHVHFNISTDGHRCVPREVRRQWQKVCFPTRPLLKVRTQCGSDVPGLYFKIYESQLRQACQCVAHQKKVAFKCRCPKPAVQMSCERDTTTVQTMTTYLHKPDGSCVETQTVRRTPVECKFPADLLNGGSNFTVRRSLDGTSISHVFSCGTGGNACLRRVITSTIVPAKSCKCSLQRRESAEACCCAQNNTKSNAGAIAVTSGPETWKDCSHANPLLVRQRKEWHLRSGVCVPTTYTQMVPLVCSSYEHMRPTGICKNGSQKFIQTRAVRRGCKCETVHKAVLRPCLCETISAAEVIFLVDESVSSRVEDYSIQIRTLLKHIISTFKTASEHNNLTDYRFAVVKYANDPSIAFNLGEYDAAASMLMHVDNLNYEGRLSNLGKALSLTEKEVLSRSRDGIVKMIYVISDGVNDKSATAHHIASKLHTAGVHINVLALGSDKRGKAFLGGLATQPREPHFISVKSASNAHELSKWLIQTLCIKACPPSKQTKSLCSRETKCTGYIFTHAFNYSAEHGRCVGGTRKRTYKCCCLQRPRMTRACLDGRIIQTKEVWQLKPNSVGLPVCHHLKLQRDVTHVIQKECSPNVVVTEGVCSATGVRVDEETYHRLEDCRCKKSVKKVLKRCFCDAKTTQKQCYGDNLLTTVVKESRLVDGKCEESTQTFRQSIVCLDRKVFSSQCDPLTCQRRLIYANEKPHQCVCKKHLTIVHESCCCPANRPVKQISCIHDDTRVLSLARVAFAKSMRTCVTTIERFYEPIACPSQPTITKSDCRPAVPSEDIGQRPDPNILYRRVEIQTWQVSHCQCMQRHHWEYELCGCREPKKRNVQECHKEHGVFVNYQQSYLLTVIDVNRTISGGDALGTRVVSLSQARCRLVYSGQAIKNTLCPDSNVLKGPCIRKEGSNGRAYRRIERDEWEREGCVCKQSPLQISQKLCGCRDAISYVRKCSNDPRNNQNVLIIHRTYERLVPTRTNDTFACKIEIEKLTQKIECPAPKVRYTDCINGTLWVTVELISLRKCKCHQTPFRRRMRCMQFNSEGVPVDGSKHNFHMLKMHGNFSLDVELKRIQQEHQQSVAKLKQKLSQFGLPNVKSWPNDAPNRASSRSNQGKPLKRERKIILVNAPVKRLPPSGPATLLKSDAQPSPLSALNLMECADILPTVKCKQLERQPHRRCDKSGEIRDQLCRKTCKVCSACVTSQTDFKLVPSSNSSLCLLTDLRFDRAYYIAAHRKGGFWGCKQACLENSECQSFDFYVPKKTAASAEMTGELGTCVLNRIDLPTLRKRFLPTFVSVGAGSEILAHHNAKHCLLFHKICLQKCNQSRLNFLSSCTCEVLRSNSPFAEEVITGAEPKSGREHCSRAVEFISWEHNVDGSCQKRIWRGHVTCQNPVLSATTDSTPVKFNKIMKPVTEHPSFIDSRKEEKATTDCIDVQPTSWCEEKSQLGACKDRAFKKMCGGTCGHCLCKRGYTYHGSCQKNNRMIILRIHNLYDRSHGRCVVQRETKLVVCDRCPNPFEIVGKCDDATQTRLVIKVSTRMTTSIGLSRTPPRCVVKIKQQKFNCGGCTFSDGKGMERRSVSACILTANGKRQLIISTEYMVNNSGCCEVRRSNRIYACGGCPSAQLTFSHCTNNFRLQSTAFFTRVRTGRFRGPVTVPTSASQCVRHVLVRKVACVEPSSNVDCEDLIGLNACEEFKHLGHCISKQNSARFLCAQTCGFC